MYSTNQAPRKIAFVTYRRSPGLDPSDVPAVEPLRAFGIEVEPTVWDSPAVPWAEYNAVILRSCWDYHEKLPAFMGWVSHLEALGVPLWNPPNLLRWNLDKLYLRNLQERGIPVLPTVWLEQGSADSLLAILIENGWDEAVVKPTISAGAYRTWRTSQATAQEQQLDFERLLADGGTMVQQFAEVIVHQGEWSLIFFRSGYSHSVIKLPQAGDFRVQNHHGGTIKAAQPPPFLIAQAERVLDEVQSPWLYARIDGCRIGGELHLMELEMLEPSLFLDQDYEASWHFARAIRSVLGKSL